MKYGCVYVLTTFMYLWWCLIMFPTQLHSPGSISFQSLSLTFSLSLACPIFWPCFSFARLPSYILSVKQCHKFIWLRPIFIIKYKKRCHFIIVGFMVRSKLRPGSFWWARPGWNTPAILSFEGVGPGEAAEHGNQYTTLAQNLDGCTEWTVNENERGPDR